MKKKTIRKEGELKDNKNVAIIIIGHPTCSGKRREISPSLRVPNQEHLKKKKKKKKTIAQPILEARNNQTLYP